MKEILSLAKALSDENRVRTLLALEGRELCVCQITELLRLAPSTVSKHMSILHQAQLVESRKDGRWVYYRLAEEGTSDAAATVLQWLWESLAHDPLVRKDATDLKRILKRKPEDLCKNQGRCS
ncbi:MAG: metalloregulator ArsR/SmtB family transcription factor [Planctomycetia bacterium]|jgi:DNA-binding transcriptional ArsR family regulator